MLNPPFKYREKGKSFKNETVSPWKLQSSRNSEWTHAKKKKKKDYEGLFEMKFLNQRGRAKSKIRTNLHPSRSDTGNKLDYDVKG